MSILELLQKQAEKAEERLQKNQTTFYTFPQVLQYLNPNLVAISINNSDISITKNENGDIIHALFEDVIPLSSEILESVYVLAEREQAKCAHAVPIEEAIFAFNEGKTIMVECEDETFKVSKDYQHFIPIQALTSGIFYIVEE